MSDDLDALEEIVSLQATQFTDKSAKHLRAVMKNARLYGKNRPKWLKSLAGYKADKSRKSTNNK